MRISVCGKGGSGKSTVVALLAEVLRVRGFRVLVVDSDESNSGLFRMLGLEQAPVPLMELVGGKKGLMQKMMGRFSSQEPGAKVDVLTDDRILTRDIPRQCTADTDNLRLVNVGKILEPLEGCACPMGLLSKEFLGKLSLENNEIVIVDMEAGIEHFGRGVETSIDTVLVVVEPSLESLELAAKVKHLATGAGVGSTWALLNKVTSDELAQKLRKELDGRGLEVIGILHQHPEVCEACLEGHKVDGETARREIAQIVDRLLSR
jgi:CO dehydrogenase maturation factor